MFRISRIWMFAVLIALVGCAAPATTEAPAAEPTTAATAAPTTIPRVEGHLIMATTTSTQDSGLLDVILPDFQEKTGITVDYVAVGTGQAIALGAAGSLASAGLGPLLAWLVERGYVDLVVSTSANATEDVLEQRGARFYQVDPDRVDDEDLHRQGYYRFYDHVVSAADYDAIHANPWPDMMAAIAEAGFRNYSGFRRGAHVAYYGEYYPDMDRDGAGDLRAQVTLACTRPRGFVDSATDCDDNNVHAYPGHSEICDGGWCRAPNTTCR